MASRVDHLLEYVMRLDPLLRRVILVGLTAVTFTVLLNVVQGAAGRPSNDNAYRIVQLPAYQLEVTGNCPDARSVAGDAVRLGTMIGDVAADLRLLPTSGCAVIGDGLRRYRLRVRTANLTMTIPQRDWMTTDVALRRTVVAVQVRSLRALYPWARVTVSVSVEQRIVMRARANPAEPA